MKKAWIVLTVAFWAVQLSAQNCEYFSKGNDMVQDKPCAPVAASWEITYGGLSYTGPNVQFYIDWDDGTPPELVDPTFTAALNRWEYTGTHSYPKGGDQCNYETRTMLVVDGEMCTSSIQTQQVTVWDTDDENGGVMSITPEVFPICLGNDGTVTFTDASQWNCVPPIEEDRKNTNSRWIQWVYGTGGTTILDATVDGSNRSFPFRSPVEKTPQPVEGPVPPMNTSMEIYIPDYYAVGDYFEVTLRNWNQCNPYDDPSIPGPPADVINGDFPPVETTAMALIVALPDGSITAVGPFCDNITAQYLNAATPGGMWTGSGIIDEFTGLFHPGTAGPGTHLISYAVTDAKGCSATGTTNIEVLETPSLSLTDGSPIYLCPGLNKQLEVNISGGATPYSYSWSGDTGPLSSTSVTKPIFETTTVGSYDLRFSVEDNEGCRRKLDINIAVEPVDITFIPPTLEVCQGSPLTLQPIVDGGSRNYILHEWSGTHSDKLSATDVEQPEFDTSETGTFNLRYRVTDDMSCSDEAEVTVVVKPQPTVSAGDDALLCTNTQTLTASSVPPLNGLWQQVSGPAPASFSSSTTPTTQVQVTDLGSYIFSWSVDLDGCRASDEVDITFGSLPNPGIMDPQEICGLQATLEAHPDRTGGQWLVVDGPALASLDDSSSPLTEVQVAEPGAYTFRWTESAGPGCEGSAEVVLTFRPQARALVDPLPPQSCAPYTVNFNNQSQNAASYRWELGGGAGSTETNPEFTYENLSSDLLSHTIVLHAENQYGCNDSFSFPLNIAPRPLARASATPIDGCSPLEIAFSNNSLGATTYRWDFDDGSAAVSEAAPTHTFINTASFVAVHQVQLTTENDFGCSDQTTLPLTVYPGYQAGLSALPLSGCSPLEVSFEALPGAATYLWDFGDGSSEEGSALNSHLFTWEGVGTQTFEVTVTGSSIFNCSATARINIQVENCPPPSPPLIAYGQNAEGCPPLTVNFSNNTEGADSYLWEFGDGRMSHETTPTHTYQAPGTYQVQLTATGPGGTSQSSEVQVRVYQNPTALFDVVPKIIYLPGERPVFINRSENASDYLWDMGDGSTYRDFAPNHTYTQPGLYTIGLTAISPEGCEDSYQMNEVLKAEVGGELAFPNAFTPDPSGPSGGRYEFGDPRNTVFYPSTQKGVSEYLLQIYTRWGELVFESKDVEIGWDGYHNKRLAPQGVYIWRVQYKTADGRMNTRAGDVTLIR